MGSKDKGEHTWKVMKKSERMRVLELELARVNGRIATADRREKYLRMSESEFAFFRGTAHLYYRDLAAQTLLKKSLFNNETTLTWVQGDLHINNFGAFCNAEEEIVYDLNDFDDAWINSYLCDVWRCAVSIFLAGRDNGFTDKKLRSAVGEFALQYLNELEQDCGREGRHLGKVTVDKANGPLRKFLEKAARKNSRRAMLDDWTIRELDVRRFDLKDPELRGISPEDFILLRSAVSVYKDGLKSKVAGKSKYFTVLDAARRVGAGVGSLGSARYYVLIRGKNDHADTCRILDIKEQGMPSMFHFLPEEDRTKIMENYDLTRAGARVAHAQRAMLMDPDPHLGSISILGRAFSIRERSPFKKRLKVEKLVRFKDFFEMAHHWGTILAAAHARADKDYNPMLVIHNFEEMVTAVTAGAKMDFVREVVAFGENYADQVRQDFKLFEAMGDKGILDIPKPVKVEEEVPAG